MKTNTQQEKRHGLRPARLAAAMVIGLFAAANAGAAGFTLPFYEPFPSGNSSALPYNGYGYENNEELGQSVTEPSGASSSSTVWTFGNSISSSCSRILSTNGQSGLEYPGLLNVDATYQTGLLSTYIKDTSSTKSRAAVLAIPTNNASAPMAVYASCLVNVQTSAFVSATDPSPFFGLTTNTSGSSVNQAGAVVYINENFQLQISKNSSTPAASVFSIATNTTHLIVLRYQYTPAGSNDSVDLWVDPTALGSNVVVPAPTMSTTNNANLSSNFFGAVGIFQYANPCLLYIDEIRVSTNWGDVTPTNAPAGAIYAVTGGGAGCGDTAFNVGLSGSDVGVTYLLYTNAQLTGASFDGTGSAFNFSPQSTTALYTVVASNNTTFNESWMSGSASVTVLSAPAILTQPQPLTLPAGELGCFTVVSSGGGLTYQWYKGGAPLGNANEFSGVQTSNLVIFPVTSQDVAAAPSGYYVVISNACGTSVSSITNALSLGNPANLTWYGDGVSNLWDVGLSTNWNTDTAVFHYGDDVTFDDSSPNANVTLNNNFLSPSTITINGSQNAYVFNSPGDLAGSGSIVMNSSASLTLGLGLVNTETGGIIISNGTLNFDQAQNLGAGAITLAGGELAAGNVGEVFIDNVIDVTATNSTISIDATGGQPLVLTNVLNGISGNLTFINNVTKSGGGNIELTYPSFTFGLPITFNLGTLGTQIVLSGNNTSGTQVFTGVISGPGTIERNAGGGTSIFDATNDFSGGTILETGSIGVGIDSVSSSPPTIDSGPLGTGTLSVSVLGSAPTLFASGGPHILGNAIAFSSNILGPAFVISGSNDLDLSGTFDLYGTNRTLEVDNTGATVQSGGIEDSQVYPPSGLTKTGAGVLYLDGANTYGDTTNSNGTLAGSGSLSGPVVVQSGATLGAGDASTLGTLTLNGGLTLAGNVLIRVNKSLSPSQSNDVLAVTGTPTNTGTGALTVSNLGPALAVGNKFTVFTQAMTNGSALSVSGSGVNWSNNLAIDGSISVASIIVRQPPQFTGVTVSAGNLVVSGTNGSTGSGYVVLTSTNLAAPLANWIPVQTNSFGAGGGFSATIPIATNAPGSFYTLKLQ